MGGGFSKVRLGRMHDTMTGYVERGEVPGLVALACRQGEVHVEALGAKSIGGGASRARHHLPDRSMSKPVTAVAAMILAARAGWSPQRTTASPSGS